MNVPTLCPYCLEQLPDNYPYDHVAIDLALQGRATVHGDERDEAIRVARNRGMTYTHIERVLGVNNHTIKHAAGTRRPRHELDDAVRRLYAAELDDGRIAIALGVSRGDVQQRRARLGLPALYGACGRRINQQEVAA